jgi:hypothetical protein
MSFMLGTFGSCWRGRLIWTDDTVGRTCGASEHGLMLVGGPEGELSPISHACGSSIYLSDCSQGSGIP